MKANDVFSIFTRHFIITNVLRDALHWLRTQRSSPFQFAKGNKAEMQGSAVRFRENREINSEEWSAVAV